MFRSEILPKTVQLDAISNKFTAFKDVQCISMFASFPPEMAEKITHSLGEKLFSINMVFSKFLGNLNYFLILSAQAEAYKDPQMGSYSL